MKGICSKKKILSFLLPLPLPCLFLSFLFFFPFPSLPKQFYPKAISWYRARYASTGRCSSVACRTSITVGVLASMRCQNLCEFGGPSV